jgi:diguanylate cyclase (GGDEF)-like protein
MFSIVLIDIDDFKLINDVYGHQTADMVLKELSERLKKSLRRMDIPARFGGDEFAGSPARPFKRYRTGGSKKTPRQAIL